MSVAQRWGAAVIVVGCAMWSFVVGLLPTVDAAAVAVDGGTDEIQLWAVELRFAVLLVVLAGVAMMYAPASLSVGRAYCGLALSVVLLAVGGGLLAMLVDAGVNAAMAALLLLAVALSTARLATWMVARPSSVGYADRAGQDVSRRFLLGVSAMLLASVPPAEYLINEIWNTDAVPGSYELAVKSTQVLLAMAALRGHARRGTPSGPPLGRHTSWVLVGASTMALALTGWLVVTPTDGSSSMWIAWGALLVVMPVVAASTDRVVTVRRVLIRAGFVAVTFPLVAIPAIYAGLAFGFFEFATGWRPDRCRRHAHLPGRDRLRGCRLRGLRRGDPAACADQRARGRGSRPRWTGLDSPLVGSHGSPVVR